MLFSVKFSTIYSKLRATNLSNWGQSQYLMAQTRLTVRLTLTYNMLALCLFTNYMEINCKPLPIRLTVIPVSPSQTQTPGDLCNCHQMWSPRGEERCLLNWLTSWLLQVFAISPRQQNHSPTTIICSHKDLILK